MLPKINLKAALLVSVVAGLIATPAFASVDSPITVDVSLSHYPGRGRHFDVRATVTATRDLPGATALIELPEGAELVEGSLQWSGDLRANIPVLFTAKVRLMRPGNQGIRASARAAQGPDAVFSGAAYAYLNVKDTHSAPGLEALGGDPRRVHAFELAPGTGTPGRGRNDEAGAPAMNDRAPEPPAADPGGAGSYGAATSMQSLSADVATLTAGMLTVTGRWSYYNRAGTIVGMDTLLMELVRGDNDAHLAFVYTNSTGDYTFPEVTNPGAAGVKVKCWTYTKWAPNNYELMVLNLGGSSLTNAYYGTTTVKVLPDGVQSAGIWNLTTPASDPKVKAWWGIADLNKAFRYPPNQPGGAKVEWSPTSTDGAHYHPGGNIHLQGGDLDNYAHTLTHEFGHQIMYNRYGYFPSTGCPSPHYIERLSAAGCGWTEGWANFYAMAVLNDPYYRWSSGGSLNLETPTWFTSGWDEGASVEGRVAGALWDLMDSTSDGYDTYADGFSNVWATFYNQSDNNFGEYWSAWQARGYDLRRFRASAFQNTIDYDYKPRFALTWGATPADMDNHLWLPSTNQSHVYLAAKGSSTAFPWATLDLDDRDGYGPENTTIYKPYNGTYTVGVQAFGTTTIAGTGAKVSYYLGPYLVTSWTVPTTGTGAWWKVATLNGLTGAYTTSNLVQSTSPAPY